MMQPISALAGAAARKVMCVLTDIDDTLTTYGRLPAAAYTALETLHNAGLKVVPLACGVANASGGEGFVEIVERLLAARGR